MTAKEVFHLLVEVPWIVFLLYWIVSAIRTRVNRSKKSLLVLESPFS